jgi:probable DNA metabolism protein
MIYLYDGTYEGLLSTIFESYRLKTPATKIIPESEWQESLFDHPLTVSTHSEWAQRVERGLAQKTSRRSVQLLYRCFLSEREGIEMLIYDYVRQAMEASQNIEGNYRDDTVLSLQKIDKMIGREVHRMHAFVRFQQTKDDIYYAGIEPDFNVLPLITSHFKKRYPAQDWLIYDLRRHYGMYFDQQSIQAVTFSKERKGPLKQLSGKLLEEAEIDYQQAWKLYFKSTNIPERRNMKLHLQHVPRRYWKYLVEKQ